MAKRGLILIPILLFLFGVGILLYPLLGAYWNQQHESEICLEYSVQAAEKAENQQELVRQDLLSAQAYNRMLAQSVIYSDSQFKEHEQENSEYNDLLNVTDDGVMAYLEIPKIEVNLPIYHGADAETLEKGIGHLPETSLPIGGDSTHAVLSGHTGMKYARLFTDLNQLCEGDYFYVHVYEERLVYQVDQIKTVLPTNTADLQVIAGEDHVTLMTCTPYGVNSHRLLVRGTRVLQPEKQAESDGSATETHSETKTVPTSSTWMQEYWKSVILGLRIAVGAVVVIAYLMMRRRG